VIDHAQLRGPAGFLETQLERAHQSQKQ
jgi:hypothetical protein